VLELTAASRAALQQLRSDAIIVIIII